MRHVFATLSACLLLAVPASALHAATVTVFAAASLKESMDAQARAFEARGGDRVVVVYAASNALARQVEAGAPADVFVSADLEWMDYLDQRGVLAPKSRVTLLRNTLVLIAPAASKANVKIGPGFALADALGGGRLAVANPDSVPAGKYAKHALEALGVWPSVQNRLARTENVRAALALVSRSEAPFGIVYATDAMADLGVRIVDTFPAASHPPIAYPAALIGPNPSPAAKALLAFLRLPEAAATWRRYGFGLAQ